MPIWKEWQRERLRVLLSDTGQGNCSYESVDRISRFTTVAKSMSEHTTAQTREAAQTFTAVQTGLLQRKCACGQHVIGGGTCANCSTQSNTLQRRAAHESRDANLKAAVPAIVQETLRSSGQPLDAGVRSFMEPRFGHDFSRVRVHTDERAAQSARAVNALAYTVGRDVVFGAGQYAPQTSEGRKLIAHELTHTVQQSFTNHHAVDSLSVSSANDAGEREAEQAASDISHAAPAINHAASALQLSMMPPQLQRKPEFEDPIHEPLIEGYRREQGLPLSGVDEFGRPVGPSAAQIKYGPTRRTLCPRVGTSGSREDLSAAICWGGAEPGTPLGCDFRPEQVKYLRVAQAEAASRVKRAAGIVSMSAHARANAAELAKQLFLIDPPPITQVVEVLGRLVPLLSGDTARFAGRTCADQTCQSGATVAYVTASGQLPIYICPLAFNDPSKLFQIVLHEALHWAGIDADPTTPELYCPDVDCKTPCGGADVADSWMHYLSCLGAPITVRKDFRDKIIDSVKDID